MTAIGSVLLDTSIVDQVDDVYVPLAVLGELLYGAHKSNQAGKALAQVQEFCRGCIVLLPVRAAWAQLTGALASSIASPLCCAPARLPSALLPRDIEE